MISLLEFSLTWGVAVTLNWEPVGEVLPGAQEMLLAILMDVNQLDFGSVYSTRALTIVSSAAKGGVGWTILENTSSTAVVVNVLVII